MSAFVIGCKFIYSAAIVPIKAWDGHSSQISYRGKQCLLSHFSFFLICSAQSYSLDKIVLTHINYDYL